MSSKVWRDLYLVLRSLVLRLDELDDLLTSNTIWKYRLIGIGQAPMKLAASFSFSGVLLRATGIYWDLRKSISYETYPLISFRIPVSFNSDCYDRFLLRVEEMRQSIVILFHVLKQLLLLSFPKLSNSYLVIRSLRMFFSMEANIAFFKRTTRKVRHQLSNVTVLFVEAPKGEFGILLYLAIPKGTYRCKIRSPGFFHLQSFDVISFDHMLADVSTLMGTQDIVFGEIDR